MLVELDIFSGRPNPRWELDERSSRRLLELQSHLTSASSTPPEPPGLGYRGFVYAHSRGQVRSYRGYVQTSREVLADPTFSVEHFLLDQLPPEYAALRAEITADLRRGQ